LPIRLFFIAMLAAMLSQVPFASAEPLPSPEDLRTQIGSNPIVVEVIEPHLSDRENHTLVEYVGFHAEEVLAVVLGQDWREQEYAFEFRALDGYVSRIDAARFKPGKAYLVFARADGEDFVVDNIAQNQQRVPLGPYYLVWDNIGFPELLAEGAGNWPYQVSEITLASSSEEALQPMGLAAPYRRGAELAKEHCLNCHRINGYGGDKFTGDLAAITRNLARAYFVGWVLNPSSIRGGTTMPALTSQLSEAERVQITTAIYDYLINLPQL
jgi:mono/diheme cytochrome c family protein